MTPSAALHRLTHAPHHRKGLRLFQVFLGLALLFRAATELRFAPWLWGPHGIGTGSSAVVLGAAAPLVDWLYALPWAGSGLLLLEGVGALLLVAGRWTRWAAVLCLVPVLLLEWRTSAIADGGDNLARLALGYMLLALPSDAPQPPPGALRTYLHNLGVVLLISQVLILYFTAGLAKASGEAWMNGTALYLVSQVEEFSLPGLRELLKQPLLTGALSTLTVVWQVLFPIGVFSRLKLGFLAIGLAFHLGIAFFMGLVSFSLVMAGAELMLLTDEDVAWLGARAARARGWARGALRLQPAPS